MIRFPFVLLALIALTLVLLPFQLIALAFDLRLQRSIPHLFHRVLCFVVGVRIHEVGQRAPNAPALILANHVSWLDIFLIDAMRPARFVAKSEIAGWPLVGTLVTRAGTLYIDRGSRKAARETNALIARAMQAGALVACFPEGTTSHGASVGRFHGALFQPAIDASV